MKTNFYIFVLLLIISGCSKSIEYTPDFIEQTSGRYLYSPDEVVEVYYEENDLYLKWRGVDNIKPVVFDQHTFFVADMYKKLRFVENTETKEKYLSIVDPENEDAITYDFLKLTGTMDTPSGYLEKGDYEKAREGYLQIQKEDPEYRFIEERELNSYGYTLIRKKNYEKAIAVFKINVALYPESSNVYDSLAEAYLISGDSVQTFNYYSKALELNPGNEGAKKFLSIYNKEKN